MTFLLTQRSIDLGFLLTWLTLAAFLVQITSTPSFFQVPNCFSPFSLQKDSWIKNEKPESHNDKPVLVCIHMKPMLFKVLRSHNFINFTSFSMFPNILTELH